MIADWSVELGLDAPSIEVPWEGWRELRKTQTIELQETDAYPELGTLLGELAGDAHLVTSKCDVFPVNAEDADPDLALALSSEEMEHGLGSYVDVICVLDNFAAYEQLARYWVTMLDQAVEIAACAELVIRPASVFGSECYGLTLYVFGYGRTGAAARETWGRALRLVCSATIRQIGLRTRFKIPDAPQAICMGE